MGSKHEATKAKIIAVFDEYADRGERPTMRDIASAVNRSHVTVWEHVRDLIQSGKLRKKKNRNRKSSTIYLADRCRLCGSRRAK